MKPEFVYYICNIFHKAALCNSGQTAKYQCSISAINQANINNFDLSVWKWCN